MDPNFDRLRRRFNSVPAAAASTPSASGSTGRPTARCSAVFSGIAESRGYRVCKVRWIGIVFVLLFLATGVADAHGLKATVLVCGFFYLLLALLMQSPRASAGRRR